MYYPKKLARPSQLRSCKLLSKVIQNVDKELKRKSHDGYRINRDENNNNTGHPLEIGS